MKVTLEFDLDNETDAERFKNAMAADRAVHFIDDFLDFLSLTGTIADSQEINPLLREQTAHEFFEGVFSTYRSKIMNLDLVDILKEDVHYLFANFTPYSDENDVDNYEE